MPFAAVTADLLGKFQSVARNVLFSQNPASADTFVIAHRLTNAGGKGISYYVFRPVLRTINAGILTFGQAVPPVLDSWNGSQAIFRHPSFAGSAHSATYDIICEDPHSITW